MMEVNPRHGSHSICWVLWCGPMSGLEEKENEYEEKKEKKKVRKGKDRRKK
jgi:hypothetical protein